MAKIVLPRISAGFMVTEAFNSAMQLIEMEFDGTIARDGATPNQMEAQLDMNGQSILNAGFTGSDNELPKWGDVKMYVDAQASGLLVQRITGPVVATVGQTVFISDYPYEPGSNGISVYVNGERLFLPDFVETNPTTITLVTPLSGGQEVTLVVNDFLGSLEAPPEPVLVSDVVTNYDDALGAEVRFIRANAGAATNAPDAFEWTAIYLPGLNPAGVELALNRTGPPQMAFRRFVGGAWTPWQFVWNDSNFDPTTKAAVVHTHAAADITSGRLADARRGVYVQAGAPASPVVGDLWFF